MLSGFPLVLCSSASVSAPGLALLTTVAPWVLHQRPGPLRGRCQTSHSPSPWLGMAGFSTPQPLPGVHLDGFSQGFVNDLSLIPISPPQAFTSSATPTLVHSLITVIHPSCLSKSRWLSVLPMLAGLLASLSLSFTRSPNFLLPKSLLLPSLLLS